jgi:hypothetical protein
MRGRRHIAIVAGAIRDSRLLSNKADWPSQNKVPVRCEAPLVDVPAHQLQCDYVSITIRPRCHANHGRAIHQRVGQVGTLLSAVRLARHRWHSDRWLTTHLPELPRCARRTVPAGHIELASWRPAPESSQPVHQLWRTHTELARQRSQSLYVLATRPSTIAALRPQPTPTTPAPSTLLRLTRPELRPQQYVERRHPAGRKGLLLRFRHPGHGRRRSGSVE